jgi:PAS domain S-box-containing protein
VRKELELKLIEFEIKLEIIAKKYKLVADNMNDMVCLMDLTASNFTFVAGACYDIFGYTPEEYLQMPVKDTMPAEAHQFILEFISSETERFEQKEVEHPQAIFEIQQYHKDGSLVWVEISARAMSNEKGELTEIVAVTRDINKRKESYIRILRQKINLEQQKKLLEEQTKLLEEQAALLEEANATKNKFFSIIAHDLKNPILSLLQISEFLIDDYTATTENKPLTDDDILKINNNAARSTYALLENLLEWSRSQMGSIVYTPARNDITKIIDNCVSFLQVQAKVKDINITTSILTTECYVNCDANMVLTVIRNLISNAIKFSFYDSIIEITVMDFVSDNSISDNNYIQVSVKDSGTGISQENIDKLFKVDKKVVMKGTNQETGTGLGLILCKEFIDKHSNCKIWVESELGKGTTFLFTLPKMPDE